MQHSLRIPVLFGVALLAFATLGGDRAEAGLANILISDATLNQVDEYTADGAFVRTFIPASAGLVEPGFLKFGPDGNLYVSSDNGVIEFDGSTGAFIRNTGLGGSLYFGPGGTAYTVLPNANRVDRVDVATGAILQSYTSMLEHPSGLTFRPNGNLLVSNVFGSTFGSSITEINPTTGAASTFSDGYGEPFALATGPDGRYYAANGSFGNGVGSGLDNSVQVVGDSGGSPSIFTALGVDGIDLAFDGGTLFVVSYYGGPLIRIDGSTGAVLDAYNIANHIGPDGIAVRPSSVPEPSTLFGCGLIAVALAGYGLRRRKTA